MRFFAVKYDPFVLSPSKDESGAAARNYNPFVLSAEPVEASKDESGAAASPLMLRSFDKLRTNGCCRLRNY